MGIVRARKMGLIRRLWRGLIEFERNRNWNGEERSLFKLFKTYSDRRKRIGHEFMNSFIFTRIIQK